MRLKSFSAPTVAKAMAMVRAELGKDAIIVSNRSGPDGGIEIVAAVEPEPMVDAEPIVLDDAWSGDDLDVLQEVLDYHRAPVHLIEKLYSAARVLETNDPLLALAGALDAGFTFAPLVASASPRPLMLVGPPGAGKTATIAKLAARSLVAGRSVAMITTDTVHTGAAEQFAGYAALLRSKFWCVAGSETLRGALDAANGAQIKLIDTTGASPFDPNDLARLMDLTTSSDAEPVLVLPAGMDPLEAAETAEAFLPLGVERLVTTRVDTARRLGGLLAAGEAAKLKLSDAGTGPHIGSGLNPLNPIALARVLASTPADRISTLSTSEP